MHTHTHTHHTHTHHTHTHKCAHTHTYMQGRKIQPKMAQHDQNILFVFYRKKNLQWLSLAVIRSKWSYETQNSMQEKVMYLWCSLCTLHLLTCQVRVTVGDWVLCCQVHMILLSTNQLPLFCLLIPCESALPVCVEDGSTGRAWWGVRPACWRCRHPLRPLGCRTSAGRRVTNNQSSLSTSQESGPQANICTVTSSNSVKSAMTSDLIDNCFLQGPR